MPVQAGSSLLQWPVKHAVQVHCTTILYPAAASLGLNTNLIAEGGVDFVLPNSKHGSPAQVEHYACSLSSVYTFGPTFRAENSHTSRHLAEFWMIEPEIAFANLEDDMACAEDYVRFCCKWLLEHCR